MALTGKYELYCANTPVGNVVLNDAETTVGAPSTITSGQTFTITNYQTTVNIPQALAVASQALGSADLQGQASTAIDATGATPANLPEGPFTFDVPIPATIPSDGLTLNIPASPLASIGPFTASGDAVTIQQDANSSLSLVVSGTSVSLGCTSYPNDSVTPSGIAPMDASGNYVVPSVPPIAPVIAVINGGTTATTAPVATQHGTTTTTSPGGATTTNSSSLAFTGTGPGTKLMAVLGALLVLAGLVMLGLVDAPRRMLRAIAVASPSSVARRLPQWRPHMPQVRMPALPKLHVPKVHLPDMHPMQRVTNVMSSVHTSRRSPAGSPPAGVEHPGEVASAEAGLTRQPTGGPPPGAARKARRGASWLLGR